MPAQTKKPRKKPRKKPAKIKPEPWEKQKGDTPKSFETFRLYRDMGPTRSFAKVAKDVMAKEATTMPAPSRRKQGSEKTRIRKYSGWSSKGKWAERVDAWDIEQDRMARAEQKKTVTEMMKRLAEQAILVQTKGLQQILDMDHTELTRKEALEYYVKGVEMEAKFREVPDLKIEHTGKIKTHENELERTIASDPETKAKINDILTELSTANTRRLRTPGKRDDLDTSTPSDIHI